MFSSTVKIQNYLGENYNLCQIIVTENLTLLVYCVLNVYVLYMFHEQKCVT